MALPEELYEGVFYVTQLTRGTALEKIVGVDEVCALSHTSVPTRIGTRKRKQCW